MSTRKPYTLEEQPGDRYPSLQAAQRIALAPLAGDLAATIQSLLSAGVLVLDGNKITPRRKE